MLPFITALCPTYRKPDCLRNSLACWLAQEYPRDRCELLIHDSANQFATQAGESWRLTRLEERPPSLPAKYNAMIAAADSRTDLFVVWDDDDVYLPHHLGSHVAAMQRGTSGLDSLRGHWSKPREVLSTYTRQPLVESAAGRFHGSIAIGADMLRTIGGWPLTLRADFDQQIIATLQANHSPADPIDIAPPSYVFRWGSTGVYHSQHVMRDPADETWYARVPDISHQLDSEPITLTPRMDEETASLFAQWAPLTLRDYR